MIEERPDAPPSPYRPPPGACDAHCHIVGPKARFPLAPGRRSGDAEDAAKESLVALHDALGIERAVIVHSALHGYDLSPTLDALAAHPKRFRGVALLEPTVGDKELDRLHALGVRGVRHNFVSLREGALDAGGFLRLGERAAERGWHFLVHMHAQQIAPYGDLLKKTRATIVFDHLMRLDPEKGLDQPELRQLEGFLANGAWVKIGAVDKLSRTPYPHHDVVAIAAQLARFAPDRVIWGSDWPHPDGRGLRGGRRPSDRGLLDLVPLYAPDPRTREKIMVDNPRRLYGFD